MRRYDNSLWRKLKRYLNERAFDGSFSKKDVFLAFAPEGFWLSETNFHYYRSDKERLEQSKNKKAITVYLAYLTSAGFIVKIGGKMYRVSRAMYDGLTLTEVKRIAVLAKKMK